MEAKLSKLFHSNDESKQETIVDTNETFTALPSWSIIHQFFKFFSIQFFLKLFECYLLITRPVSAMSHQDHDPCLYCQNRRHVRFMPGLSYQRIRNIVGFYFETILSIKKLLPPSLMECATVEEGTIVASYLFVTGIWILEVGEFLKR